MQKLNMSLRLEPNIEHQTNQSIINRIENSQAFSRMIADYIRIKEENDLMLALELGHDLQITASKHLIPNEKLGILYEIIIMQTPTGGVEAIIAEEDL